MISTPSVDDKNDETNLLKFILGLYYMNKFYNFKGEELKFINAKTKLINANLF